MFHFKDNVVRKRRKNSVGIWALGKLIFHIGFVKRPTLDGPQTQFGPARQSVDFKTSSSIAYFQKTLLISCISPPPPQKQRNVSRKQAFESFAR